VLQHHMPLQLHCEVDRLLDACAVAQLVVRRFFFAVAYTAQAAYPTQHLLQDRCIRMDDI
jgi:hypothetical protein